MCIWYVYARRMEEISSQDGGQPGEAGGRSTRGKLQDGVRCSWRSRSSYAKTRIDPPAPADRITDNSDQHLFVRLSREFTMFFWKAPLVLIDCQCTCEEEPLG